jgi:dihydrolipoamide dehydrogenase
LKEADVSIIGGGPAGYVCAIRCAQLGLKTILIEKHRLGGECLQAGCIPSKALISVAKLFDKVKNGSRFGFQVDGLRIDHRTLQKWKAEIISTLESGIESLCRGYKVEIIRGRAEVIGRSNIIVHTSNGTEEINSKNMVLATGSQAIPLPSIEFDGKNVISAREALELTEAPKRLLIVGGGYIGLELAGAYQRFGSKIYVVELMEQLLPGIEPDLVRYVQKNLENGGTEIYLKSKVLSVERSSNSIKALIETPKGKITIEAEKILFSVGRRPLTEGLNLAKIGVEIDQKGYVKSDERMMTNVRGIYSIGDVRGEPLLAHKASKEAIVAAESIAGLSTIAQWKSIPWVIFTDPEIAGVGLTEKEAVERGYEVKKSRFPFAALGRALTAAEPEGFVRVISDSKNGLVLGVQIVGPGASDLISEAALAIEMGATVEDIALTIHPHPTLPEALMEASESAAGRPVHQLRT